MRDLPSARWAADPYGRHEMRYWDGAAWTAHVSDQGVTGTDMVPGLAAGVAADEDTAAATAGSAGWEPTGHVEAAPRISGDPSAAPTAVVPSAVVLTSGAGLADGATVVLPTGAGAAGPDDLAVCLPTAADAAPGSLLPGGPGPVGPVDVGPVDVGHAYAAGAASPGVDAFFGATPVSAKSGRSAGRRPPAKPRTGLVVAVAGLSIVGVAAGVIGFSGLPGSGRTGGSSDVVPVAAPPTSASTTQDVAPETATDDPAATQTYGGPTTSAVVTTTATAKATTTKPRTSTSTTPRVTTSTTKTKTPMPPVTSSPTDFKTYPSCPAMHQDYPHGVGRPGARDRTQGGGGQRVKDFYVSAPLYFLNYQLDFDGDGIACEA